MGSRRGLAVNENALPSNGARTGEAMVSEQSATRIEAPQNEERPDKPDIPQAAVRAVPETRRKRLGRKIRRTRLYLYAGLTVAVLVCLVALIVANTRQV